MHQSVDHRLSSRLVYEAYSKMQNGYCSRKLSAQDLGASLFRRIRLYISRKLHDRNNPVVDPLLWASQSLHCTVAEYWIIVSHKCSTLNQTSGGWDEV